MAVRGVLLVSLAALLVAGRWFYIPLRTGPAPEGYCGAYDTSYSGELVEDLWAGTASKVSDNHSIPLTWPEGFSTRRSGGNVEVLGPAGGVVAVTGRRYLFDGSASPQFTTPGCFHEID